VTLRTSAVAAYLAAARFSEHEQRTGHRPCTAANNKVKVRLKKVSPDGGNLGETISPPMAIQRFTGHKFPALRRLSQENVDRWKKTQIEFQED